MVSLMAENSSDTGRLLKGAAGGDSESWGALLTRHEEEERGKHFEFSSSYRKAGETMTEFKLRNKRGIQ